MEHLKANLTQAARFSTRAENRKAAEDALSGIERGSLRTRNEVDNYIKRALERAKQQREIHLKMENGK